MNPLRLNRLPTMIAVTMLIVLSVRANAADRQPPPYTFTVGADVSALADIDAAGAIFSDSLGPGDAFQIMRRHGLTEVRLRVFHRRTEPCCDVAGALALARRAHAAGLGVFLDFHFSDTWADPGRQDMPAAWRGLAGRALEDSVRAWTRETIATFVAAGVRPTRVQLGNEITRGMMWPAGRIARGDAREWRALAGLLRAAAEGVRAGSGTGPAPRIVVHIDRGGDAGAAIAYFDRLEHAGFTPDELAVSYYPWWHGAPAALRATLNRLAERYGRPVIVAETAYPWTLGWFDTTTNLVGAGARLLAEFPPTPEGQRAFAEHINAVVRAVPGGRGAGVFWWAPEDIAAPRRGSAWENCALFDSAGRVLPALEALESVQVTR